MIHLPLHGERLPLRTRHRQGLAVLGVGFGVRLVAVGLAGLRQEDERGGVGGLQAEREVQEDEGLDIEVREPGHIQDNPDGDDPRLTQELTRRIEALTREVHGRVVPGDG